MSFFHLFNLTGVRAMSVVMFMLLLNHASIQVMLNLVLEFAMIYFLVLIWKLPNYLTMQTIL
jgi:hypothetical protein